MTNIKIVYLHFRYYHDGNHIDRYYFGDFNTVYNQLKNLMDDELPLAEFELRTNSFPGIGSSQYVKFFR